MAQKAIVIAQKGRKIIFATEPYFASGDSFAGTTPNTIDFTELLIHCPFPVKN